MAAQMERERATTREKCELANHGLGLWQNDLYETLCCDTI